MAASLAGTMPFVPADMTQSLVVTFQEAAAILRRSLSTVRRMVRRGLLKAIPCPVRPMILRQSVIDYIASHSEVPKKPPSRSGKHK